MDATVSLEVIYAAITLFVLGAGGLFGVANRINSRIEYLSGLINEQLKDVREDITAHRVGVSERYATNEAIARLDGRTREELQSLAQRHLDAVYMLLERTNGVKKD